MPLVATSANLSGQKQIGVSYLLLFKKKDFILAGNTFGGKPSSLLDLSFYPKISILREG